jgi:transcriptional regulator with XRE-family HTH domain
MPPLMPAKGPARRPQATELASLLRDWMDRNGYKLEDVVKAVGLSGKNGITAVSRWRSGKAFPNKTNEFELSRLMGVAVEDFYPAGTFRAGSSADLEGLRETIEGLTSRFDLAEEDLLDRVNGQADRLSAIERQLYALIDRLRAQGMAELRDLAVEGRTPAQETGEQQTSGRSSGGTDPLPPTAE